jgi:uncharacterized protein YbdZ (MbtH family)
MNDVDEADFGIAVHAEHTHLMCVWPLYRSLPAGYVLAPHRGTRAQMDSLMVQQFVDTAPARHYVVGGGFPASDFTPWEGALRY